MIVWTEKLEGLKTLRREGRDSEVLVRAPNLLVSAQKAADIRNIASSYYFHHLLSVHPADDLRKRSSALCAA